MTEQFTIQQLLAVVDEVAAFRTAASWDNVGLMAGSPAARVQKILVGLDPTLSLLEEAASIGAQALLTHHPLIFKPLRSVDTDHPGGRFLKRALSADIAVIGCHTNLDLAVGGVNDVLAQVLGLVDLEPLEQAPAGAVVPGFGRLGRVAEPCSGSDFLARACRILALQALSWAGPLPAQVKRVAVCGGSGSELAELAASRGADLYLTGEVKHAVGRWAEESGFCVVDAGHFGTEQPVVAAFAALLRDRLGPRRIEVVASRSQQGPFRFYVPDGG